MSDQAAEHFSNDLPKDNGVKREGRSVSLTITLQPNGQIDFSIPTNRVLAWGLLGAAQEQLVKLALLADMKAEMAHAQAARGGLNGLLKKLGRG